jgi:hypothetical protein
VKDAGWIVAVAMNDAHRIGNPDRYRNLSGAAGARP